VQDAAVEYQADEMLGTRDLTGNEGLQLADWTVGENFKSERRALQGAERHCPHFLRLVLQKLVLCLAVAVQEYRRKSSRKALDFRRTDMHID
jgi:hypothetical protein